MGTSELQSSSAFIHRFTDTGGLVPTKFIKKCPEFTSLNC